MRGNIEAENQDEFTENIEEKKWEALKEDVPFAPEQDEKLIDPQILNSVAQGSINVARGVEADYYRYIRSQAKKEGVPADEMLAEVRAINKERRFGKNKDNIKFYHSTSIDRLSSILESGQLLSRKEREARGEDVSKLPWSSSENIQFSCDDFDENGEMIRPGLDEGRGAFGSEVSFVFGGDLMDEKSFEPAPPYPTVEKVDISEKCLGIIVKNAENVKAVESMLKEKGIDIPVYTADEYDVKMPAKGLRELKARQQVEHSMSISKVQPMEQPPDQAIVEEPEVETQTERSSNDMPEGKESAFEETLETEQSEERGIELLSETEVQNIIGLLDASKFNIERVFSLSRGSRSAEESAAILKMMSQKMFEQSNIFLGNLQNKRNLGEIELAEDVYEKDMETEFGYSAQALKALRSKAQMLPRSIAGAFVFDLQQIENNMQMIHQIASRRHNRHNQDKNPTMSKEKLVTDEAEAREYVDKSRFNY